MKNLLNKILIFLRLKRKEKVSVGYMNMALNLARSNSSTWTPATWDRWLEHVSFDWWDWKKSWGNSGK